jgi:hypothetical protein
MVEDRGGRGSGGLAPLLTFFYKSETDNRMSWQI